MSALLPISFHIRQCLLGVLETGRATVRRIHAVQVEVAAAVTWHLSIALDLASLALVTVKELSTHNPPIRSH